MPVGSTQDPEQGVSTTKHLRQARWQNLMHTMSYKRVGPISKMSEPMVLVTYMYRLSNVPGRQKLAAKKCSDISKIKKVHESA